MINKLILTNFKSHEDLSIEFTAGLNCLRGANEAGKSSALEGIAYALYGARALPMSLDETVTWGKPTTALKVELHFNHLGTDFKIIRSKSGAELTSSGVVVSGQSEVTAFVERLFGANMATASAIMLANQGEIRGALEGGAVPLIEKLSNLGLIDELITKIQDKLPCGNTKILDQKEVELAKVGDAPVADFTSLEKAVASTAEVPTQLREQLAQLDDKAVMKGRAAQDRLIAAASQGATKAGLQKRLDEVTEKLDKTPMAATVDLTEMEALAAKQITDKETLKAWEAFGKIEKPLRVFTGDRIKYLKEVGTLEQQYADWKELLRKKELEIATVTASAINQDSCALCGKMLKDVPEVVQINEAVRAKVEALEIGCASIKNEMEAFTQAFTMMAAFDHPSSYLELRAAPISKYVMLDRTHVPLSVEWNATIGIPKIDNSDYADMLKKARMANSAIASQNAVRTSLLQELSSLEEKLMPHRWKDFNEMEDRALVAAAESVQKSLTELNSQLSSARMAAANAEAALQMAKNEHASAVREHAARVKALEEVRESLKAYHFNNGIIKKLRDNRPIVAKKLWTLVLTTVSTHFSNIRGVLSTVTRTDDKFLIDSKPVAAYSGSTKDSLGLAIRIALQKTFLGNVNFMLVDEPAASFDDTRESDMLGLLASSGYEQIILVTHSDLADTFASNLIRI